MAVLYFNKMDIYSKIRGYIYGNSLLFTNVHRFVLFYNMMYKYEEVLNT